MPAVGNGTPSGAGVRPGEIASPQARPRVLRLRARIVACLRATLLIAATVGLVSHARAFDQVVHHSLVYAAAVANGFPPEEAAIIANGSYSLDENDSTTAFSLSLMGKEIKEHDGPLHELPHMRSGQVFHALTLPENRERIQRAHLERIERALAEARIPGASPQKRARALLYLGEYLHFVGDTVVHPNESALGHFVHGHLPDRGELSRAAVMHALSLFSNELRAFSNARTTGQGLPVQRLPLTPEASAARPIPARLAQDDAAHGMLVRVADSVAQSWARTYPEEQRDACSRALNAAGLGEIVGDVLERQRIARAATEVARVVDGWKDRYPDVGRFGVFRRIVLDSDGEPLAICSAASRQQCDSAEALRLFGPATDINRLPFANLLANQKPLVDERKRFTEILAGFGFSSNGALARLVRDVNGETLASMLPIACDVTKTVLRVVFSPPSSTPPADIAQLNMSASNLQTTVLQAAAQHQRARASILAAAKEPDPARRRQRQDEARRAVEGRDGLLASAARQAGVPLAVGPAPPVVSSIEPKPSSTLALLRKIDRQYKAEGSTNPLSPFLENYDGAARRVTDVLNRNPGTQFFSIPTAVRGVPTIPPPPPPPVAAPQWREPGGIKFSSTKAAELAAKLDISSIAFDAARGRIILSGAKGGQSFDLDVFADVLRLALEKEEPFFSLDANDPVARDGAIARVMAELDKKYRTGNDLIAAVRRVSPPPLVRGGRAYYFTTVDALDPELSLRANRGHDITTRLVFSPAWLRYSKVGWILYEADLAIKAVATGFLDRDGVVEPVPAILDLPGFEPLWARPSLNEAGRANFELSRARLERGVGRLDLSTIHPELYVTQRQAGTDRDLPQTQTDKDIAAHFAKHWQAYVAAVPEIARLDTVFRAYVAARFLARQHEGLAARILSFAHELPPNQPPLLIVEPVVIRIALENGRSASLDSGGQHYIRLSSGFGGGIAFGLEKQGPEGPRVQVSALSAAPQNWWQGLFAAPWYDGSSDAIDRPGGVTVALDFEGGDMPALWHFGAIALAAAMALGIGGAALFVRRMDWQQVAFTQSCAHCARIHAILGPMVLLGDAVAASSLAYLAALPLLASAFGAEAAPGWREVALSAAMAPVFILVLALGGSVFRSIGELLRPAAPRSIGPLPTIFIGARVVGIAIAVFLVYTGFAVGSAGAAVAQLLTPAVAERTFAMVGGATPVMAAAALAGAGATLALLCRWLVPFAMSSRPLALFSFTPHRHTQQRANP